MNHVAVAVGLAFAAAVQPGPLFAYLLSSTLANGWRRTLPAAFAPLVSDGPIALVALLVLGQLSPGMRGALRAAGGVLLLVLAWGVFRRWTRGDAGDAQPAKPAPRTLPQATMVNVLNPGPYLGWTLVLGPLVLDAWRESPAAGLAVVAAFYGTMIVTMIGMIAAFGTAGLLGPRARRGLLLASGGILAALGVYQLTLAVTHA